LRDILAGGVLAGGFSLLTSGLRVAGDSVGYWFSIGRAVFQLPLGLSFALVGAGYLVGIVGGVAMLLGVVLSWGIAVPWLTSLTPMPDGVSLSSFASGLWVSKVRLIGAGMIAIAAVWTLLTLIKPMIEGMRISLSVLKRGSGGVGQGRTDADLPPSVATALFVGALISWFVRVRLRVRAFPDAVSRDQAEQTSERTGTLFASGMIVGESLVGVVLAIVIVGSTATGGGDAPLAVAGPGFAPIATGIGLLAFVLMCVVFVRRVLGAGAGKG